MNNDAVHAALTIWLKNSLDLVVIKDRQQAERPALPYGMLELANWRDLYQNYTDISFEELETENSAGLKEIKASTRNEMEWVFLFYVYGQNGHEYIRKLQAISRTNLATQALQDAGLQIHEVSAANNIPELINEKWEPRVQANIILHGIDADNGIVIDTIKEYEFIITGDRNG